MKPPTMGNISSKSRILDYPNSLNTNTLTKKKPKKFQVKTPLETLCLLFTARWVAPEVITRNKYSKSSDVWSFGVTVWEVFNFAIEPYFTLKSPQDVLEFVAGGGRLKKPAICPENTWKIIEGCFQSAASSRPTFDQLKDDLTKNLDTI